MNLLILTAALFAALVACATASIGHGKVQPFPQVMPVTISDKAAIKFKPQLFTPEYVCVPYPAVDAAGETTGGLKGTKRNDACKYAPLGSQVYGRAKDLWAIMYAWYFPKGVSRRWRVPGLDKWDQLTDAARVALNNGKNFGKAKVPFSDEHYEKHLHIASSLRCVPRVPLRPHFFEFVDVSLAVLTGDTLNAIN
ncbi:NPP1 protein [Phytophthora nicotianae]|uniref:NPP1 protein n=1 Tax=Phytophthora nicotianae TaxID=4792 RepID=A0A0W8CL87_PHYNI|nr:NPP1 protein [Phytophthora nicotianae]